MGDNRHNSNGKWNTFGTSSRDKARPSLMQVPRRQVPKTPKVNNHSLLSNMPPRWIPPKERLKQQEAARKGKQPEQGTRRTRAQVSLPGSHLEPPRYRRLQYTAMASALKPPEFGAPILDDSPRTVHDTPVNEADAPEVLEHLRRQEALERARERKRRKMKRRRHLAYGIVAILIGLAFLRFGPVPFGTIQVTGSNQVSISDVMVAGNIKEPVNILQVDGEHLKQRLTHDLRIEDAKVSYILPATLKVDIKERVPVMVLQAQYAYLTIDRNGMVIDSTPSITQGRVPVVSGIQPSNLLLGDSVTDPTLKAVITYLDALSPEDLAKLGEVNVGNPNHLLAYTSDNVQIRIGDTTQLKEKAELTEQMLKDIDTKHITAQYIDLNLGAPFIKEIQ